MNNFVLILLYLSIGYGLRYLAFTPANLANYLNKFVIYLSLPAMILLQIPKLSFSGETLIPIVVAWVVMVFSVILVFFIAKYLHFSKEITGSLLLVTVLTNSSFVGIPLISAYLGERSLPYIIVYDQLGTFLALATYGTIIAAVYSAKSEVNVKVKFCRLVIRKQ